MDETSQSEDIKETAQLEDGQAMEWKSNLKRLVRRAEIARQMDYKNSLREIIDEVKKYEEKVGIEKLVEDLISEEVNIHPKMAEVANYVYELISKEFPEIKAVVLLGSSVHGGAMVREASGSIEEPDLDWGIITDKPITEERVFQINKMTTSYLPEIITKFKFRESFHLCVFVNPLFFRSIIPKNSQQIFNLLSKDKPLSSEQTLSPTNTAILFLHPSFPAEVNQRNRALLLSALKELALQNHQIWAKVTTEITEGWEKIHSLRSKHIATAGTEKDWALTGKVITSYKSINVMSKVMKDLLNSTGNS